MVKEKNTIHDAVLLAESRNGRCLSKKYINSKTKMEFKCSNGHIFYLTFYKLKHRGDWCKRCYHESRKITIEGVCDLAKSLGGQCLSKKYIGCYDDLLWKCRSGHEWFASYDRVKHQGVWCKECKRELLCNEFINTAKMYAESMGGICLSDKYIDSKTKLLWKCNEGHRWEALFSDIISHKNWCPRCRNKTQSKLTDILEKIFGLSAESNFSEFDWLINDKTGKKIEIDIFFKKLKFAVEYDGQQHFYPVKWSKKMSNSDAEKIFEDVKYRDNIKNIKIYRSSDVDYFLRFSYLDDININSVKIKVLKKFPKLKEFMV